MNSSAERLFVAAGHTIYVQGDRGDRAFLLLSGSVGLSRERDEERFWLPIRREAGDVFGDLALVSESRRLTTAVALTECELLAFNSKDLSSRIEAADPLLRVVVGAIMKRYGDIVAYTFGAVASAPVLPIWTSHVAAGHALLSFEHQLRLGLTRDEVDLFFQPIVRLSTGRLAGFEALVRWRHPQRGLLAPVDFIPFAEASGMISAVTAECMRKVGQRFPALREAAAANGAAVDRLFVSVNVSSADLAEPDFAARIVSSLGEAGVEPEEVKLEVTESVLMRDAERCAATLASCRDQGFAIAIDDFGTGYSSLHTLNALPIAVLKMDRSFSQMLVSRGGGDKIVAAILHLGRDLGLSVVAEGIETVAQRDRLAAMGCDWGQGYLFGPALALADAIAATRGWTAVPALAGDQLPPVPAARTASQA